MSALLRAGGVAALFWLSATCALASSEIENAFTLPEWSEPETIPTAIAETIPAHETAFQTESENASTDELTTEDTFVDSRSYNQTYVVRRATRRYEPSCYVSAGAVFLQRARPDADPIVRSLINNGVLSSGSNFDFGWDAGPDVTIGHQLSAANSLEARYFNDLETEASVDYGFLGAIRFAGAITAFGDLDARYATELHSAEVNGRHQLNDRLSFIVGFRWFELKDDLTYVGVNAPLSFTYNWNEMNQLYGGQLGADLNLTNRSSPLQISAGIRSGIYGLVAENHYFQRIGPPVNVFVQRVNSEGSDVAFAHEVNVSGSLRLYRHLALRGGYQLLWIDGLALASEHASASLLAVPTAVAANGDVFYNGATAAIELAW